jgi:hypothetical protein
MERASVLEKLEMTRAPVLEKFWRALAGMCGEGAALGFIWHRRSICEH